ncbi:MAG: hypothetical protein A2498_05820 [Lentisphaerae bacterium RIFOXYC12_FULL_60_16]|nr:MAG: hypothetical protein A2498_05820 [Lentisphaerae bacterium RIFOXYC12_FULL_60_16]OGV75177.1 MAG: hypothetical protein A2269_07065 [Lentisphaerae bacterium RIFOXYA12_FULL_60_10]OGV82540.1 MAG: hypothetical protein A2340_10880 [Lentisphaerae bacterium RIFOXYB12_FULL_60_10]
MQSKIVSARNNGIPGRLTDDGIDPFERAKAYPLNHPPIRLIHESSTPWPGHWTERHFQCIWFDSRWRPEKLVNHHGETVQIINLGTWNQEAGPDFLNATLRVDPGHRILHGDVELHIHPGDWTRHAHQDDPRYRNLVAHVTYHPGTVPASQLPPGCMQISLHDAWNSPPPFAIADIDIDAYPHRILRIEEPPCRQAQRTLPLSRMQSLLDAAGTERIRRKTERIELRLQHEDPDQVLYEELMAALGYKWNSLPFRLLARTVPLNRLAQTAGTDQQAAYAILMGVGGLLPKPERTTWDDETRRWIRRLWDIWWKQSSPWEDQHLPPDIWQTAGQRPQNHPARRLAVIPAWFDHPDHLRTDLVSLDTRNAQEWMHRVAGRITVQDPSNYWNSRLSTGGQHQSKPVAIVGPDRVSAIITNVIVPFIAASGKPIHNLLDALPVEQTGTPIRNVSSALWGPDLPSRAIASGLHQQGLLQIHHDCCSSNGTGCPDCPIPAWIKSAGSAPPVQQT